MADNKFNLKDLFDLGMLSTIFILTALELTSFFLQSRFDTVEYSVLNQYAFYYAPLLSSLSTLTISIFFVFRILRFSACLCTKTIVYAYFLDQITTFCLIYSGYNPEHFDIIVYTFYAGGLFGLFIKYVLSFYLKYVK